MVSAAAVSALCETGQLEQQDSDPGFVMSDSLTVEQQKRIRRLSDSSINEDVVAMKELPIIHAWVWPTGKKLPFFFKIFKNWPI